MLLKKAENDGIFRLIVYAINLKTINNEGWGKS